MLFCEQNNRLKWVQILNKNKKIFAPTRAQGREVFIIADDFLLEKIVNFAKNGFCKLLSQKNVWSETREIKLSYLESH